MQATRSDAPESVEVRRLHPITPFFDLILGSRQLAVPLFAAVFAGGDRTQAFIAVPVVLFTVAGVLRWLRFTYRVEGGSLIVDEGLLTRKRRVVPVDRIQQVDFVAKLRHRIFGVTDVRVDTAGGGSTAEVRLSVVSTAEAARLRADLLEGRAVAADTGPAPIAAVGARPVVRLSVKRLALAGVTGSELAIMLTILFWVVQLADDLPAGFVENLASRITTPETSIGFLIDGSLLILFWFGLAALASIVKFGRFTMLYDGIDIRVQRGLLDRREVTVPIHRLQAVRVQATLVRRLLGMASIRLQSGGSAGGDRAGGVSRIDVPLLTTREANALLTTLLGGQVPRDLVAAPAAARRRAILRRAIPVASLGLVAIALSNSRPLATAVAGLALALAISAGELAYRGLGHRFEHGLLVARSGGLARESVVVRAAKTQSTRLMTSPLQRRAGLATLLVDVAGGGRTPAVRDGEERRLEQLSVLVVGAEPVYRDELAARRRRVGSKAEPPALRH